MKKFSTVIMAMFFLMGVSISSANAESWNWDLSKVGAEAFVSDTTDWSSTVHFDNQMGITTVGTNYTQVVQTFTGGANDNILDNGDTFTEFGFMGQVDVDGDSVLFRDAATQQIRRVYYEFSGLSGFIANYNSGGDGDTTLGNYATNIGNDSFDLVFLPGIGTINLYIDDNFDSSDGVQGTLASFKLVAGQGTSPELIVGEAEGQFGVIQAFDSVEAGLWYLDDMTLFEMFGLDQLLMSSFNLGATLEGLSDDGTDLIFDIHNKGDLQLSTVPEPGTMLLLGFGLVGLAGLGRRKFTQKG